MGFFGEVSSSELISGDALANEIGLTEGNSFNSDAGWLKFYYDDKILFVAKKPYRYRLSWLDIYYVGAVHGKPGETGPSHPAPDVEQNANITINGDQYKVRLLTGAYDNPYTIGTDSNFACEDFVGQNSEWNLLIYRVHENVPVCDNGGPEWDGGPQIGDNWEKYSNLELGLGEWSNGHETLLQERDSTYPDFNIALTRGGGTISDFYTVNDFANDNKGWRPVLELIQ